MPVYLYICLIWIQVSVKIWGKGLPCATDGLCEFIHLFLRPSLNFIKSTFYLNYIQLTDYTIPTLATAQKKTVANTVANTPGKRTNTCTKDKVKQAQRAASRSRIPLRAP